MTIFSERFLVALLRWAARAIGIVIISQLLLAVLVMYAPVQQMLLLLVYLSPLESPILLAVLIITLGLIVAWKWEGLGGILILGGTAFCAIVNYRLVPAWCAIGTLGLLFLCCWWRTPKRTGGRRIIAGVVLLMLLVGSAVVLNSLREWAIGHDCERLIAWVRSSHLAPGAHDLALPAGFRWLSVADGRVDVTVLEDGRVILLLKTSDYYHDCWRGIVYCSSPLKPGEFTDDGSYPSIQIRDTPKDDYHLLLDVFVDAKVNDRLYFVVYNLG
jgi:hypothetical protein